MDPGQPDSKRPRLSTTSSWSPTGAPQHQLPPLHPPTPHQQAHQPHHPAPPVPPYHHQQQPPPPPPPPYPPRSAEPHYPTHPAQHQQHPDERRHHDQDPPHTPMQDHYRHPPSPSPAHPSYNPFPPRDPGGVKREPHEDNLPHPRRPHSTGGAPQDGLPPPGPHPPPPHSAPPPPVPPYNDDPRRPHMTYDNPPPPMPPTPGGYRSSYPPPPMPQQPPQQYEQPPYHSQAPPESIYSVSYASTQKRKATRASQACDSCRQLKAKCDETKPCKSCREKGVECKYRDPIPKAIDKSQTDILEGIHDLKTLIESRFIQVDRRLQALEDGAPRSKAVKLEKDASASSMSPPAKSPPSPEPTYHHLAPDPVHEEPAPMAVGETSLADADMMETVDEEHAPGAAVDPGQPSIPINHTSPVNLLLTWPAIKEMTQKQLLAEGIKYPENFPLAREVKRGMLRLFGRGEGNGHMFRTPTHGPNPVIAAEMFGSQDPADDAFSETAASPSPAGDWGQVGSLSPPSLGGGIGYSSSTLTPEGNPDYSEAKVNQYVASFMANIFTMHPIIMPGDLNLLVKRFLDSVAINGDRKAKPTNPGIAKFAPPPTQYADASSKRKRSPSGDQIEEPVLSKRPGRPHRTIESALVLVVLALGKVCLHQEKIPDPAPTPEAEHSTNSPMTRNGHPSSPGPPAHTSPPAHASHQSSGLPSPKEQNNNYSSRRPSLQGSGAKTGGQSFKRNYDIIPGLEYMAVACDILGQHQVGWTLKHAQVFILCGLYYGQLGRVIESHAHLLNADRALQMIMQRDLDRFKKITDGSPDAPRQIENRRDNIVLITYWTCLQLISDIVAELKLPLSQVLNYEEMMPYPNMTMMAHEIPVEVIKLYFGQLYLRKQLNKIHNTLYKPDPPGQEPAHPMDKFTKAMDIQRGLQSFQWIPPEYHFTEDAPPATNLNEARLRAKYWGTQTLIYRQILRLVLDIGVRTRKQDEGTTPTSHTAGGLGVFSQGDARSFIGHSVTTSDELGPQVEEYTKAGLKAFIRSTEAFHGVDSKRLLVTNIFGTAHAQWGNLLILGAAYRDPWCRQFIDGQHLQSLFQRTIKMFKTHAQTTSALAVDMRVLETVERELFSQTFDDPRTTASFSSAASGGNTQGPLGPPPPPPPPPQNNPPNNHQMSMAFAVEPNHHSAHNSPSQGHRILNHGSNHVHNHTHPY